MISRTKDQIKDEKILVQKLKYFLTIAEKVLGVAPKNLRNPSYPKLDEKTIGEITEDYQKHHSIIKTKESVKETIIINIC